MKSFLIAPDLKWIGEVDVTSDYTQIYRWIQADCFDVIRINNERDVIYVDDQGLYRQDYFFAYEGHPTPIAGRGLVQGTNSEGESIEPQGLTLEQLKIKARFISFNEALEMARTADAEAQEYIAKTESNVIYHQPVAEILEQRNQEECYTETSS